MLEQKSRPAGDRAASENVLADAITNNASYADFQLLRERRLIACHHIRPAIAGLVARLAYGGGAHG